MCNQQRLRSACAYPQSDQSHCKSLEYSIIVKLLIEHHLEFLCLKEGCIGSYESILVKMSQCWKSHVMSQICFYHHLSYFSAAAAVHATADVDLRVFFPPIVSNLPMSKLDCPSLLLRNGNKSEMKNEKVSVRPKITCAVRL